MPFFIFEFRLYLKVCKETCDEDNCNIGEPRDTTICYTCQYQMDHTGEILGTSDLNCFESAPSTNYLKECLNEGSVQKIHIRGAS